MEILNLKDFLERNNTEDINAYLDYLAEEKMSISGALEELSSVQPLSKRTREEIYSELKRKVDFISVIENIINNSMGEIIKNTITRMSEDELKSLAMAEIENISLEIERIKAASSGYEEVLKEKVENKREELRKKGLDETYLQVDSDGDLFFENSSAVSKFIGDLIDSTRGLATLEDFFYLICGNKECSEKLASTILSYRKILNYVQEKESLKLDMAEYLLSGDGIGAVISTKNRDAIREAVSTAIDKLKKTTLRFKSLPQVTQEEINALGFEGSKTYKEMQRMYFEVRENGTFNLPEIQVENNEDLSLKEEKTQQLEESLSSLLEKKELIEKSIEEGHDSLVSLYTRSVDVSFPQNYLLSNSTFKGNSNGLTCYYMQKNKMDEYSELIKLINAYLNGKNCERDFKICNAKTALRLMKSLGYSIDESPVAEIIDVYEKRFKLIKLAYEFINKLKNIEGEYKEVKHSKNIFALASEEKSTKLESVRQSYDKCCQDFLENLAALNREFYKSCTSPSKSMEKAFNGEKMVSVGGLVDDFNELEGRHLLPEGMDYQEFRRLHVTVTELSAKLLTADVDEDGFYKSRINEFEENELFECQRKVLNLYKSLLDARKEEKESYEKLASKELSSEGIEAFSKLKFSVDSGVNALMLEQMRDKMIDVVAQIDANIKTFVGGENTEIATVEDMIAYQNFLKGFEMVKVQKDAISLKI